MKSNESWIELECCISDIQNYLKENDVEITSPDGWVEVAEFVDKGNFCAYTIVVDNLEVVCNENHLFETSIGWKSAKELLFLSENGLNLHLLCEGDKLNQLQSISASNKIVPIVDLQINHINHRYYANGISSHNTNVGKSGFMCDHAAHSLLAGYNALYITLEMAEERIAERIDCNLLDCTIPDLDRMKKNEYLSKMGKLNDKNKGRLIIKEYPTGGANVSHFRALMEELKLKKNFSPDIIYVDYINICSSSRYKTGGNSNSYTIIKSIAEELRGFAVEYNVPILTATQTVRSGNNNSDLEITDVSESIGLAQTLDFMFGIMRTEELDGMKQLMVKQLKSRFGDTNYFKKFVIGSDISKFKLYDVDSQSHVSDRGREDIQPYETVKQSRSYDDISFD